MKIGVIGKKACNRMILYSVSREWILRSHVAIILGNISRHIQKYIRRDVDVKEVRCIAVGDGYCE